VITLYRQSEHGKFWPSPRRPGRSSQASTFSLTSSHPTSSERIVGNPYLTGGRVARLNVVAGATDASRAMLLTSCCKVEPLTAIFGFL